MATAVTTIAPAEIAAGIRAAWATHLARSSRRGNPHEYVYASAWRACDRRMLLELTDSDKLPPFPPEVLAKFRRGEDRERDLLSDLMRVGRDADPPFTVIGQQERFELRDRKGRVAIVGKVDARIAIGDFRAPLEVKSWSPQIVDRIESFDDLFEGTWTRSGAYQLLAYLFGSAQPFGFLLLDRSGLPLLLPVELEAHLDRVEEFLSKAERALDHRAAETLPDFLSGDAAECQRCPFYGHTCNPPLSHEGAVVLTDPELEASLERRAQLEGAADEFDRLDKDIKKRLRGVEYGIAGHFVLNGKWGKQSRLDLPPELKKQYTVTDPKGRFTLEITRLS